MSSASKEIGDLLSFGQGFYIHTFYEFSSRNVSAGVAAEKAKILLCPEFQAKKINYARSAATSAANAAKVIRGRATALMPLIEKDLALYYLTIS